MTSLNIESINNEAERCLQCKKPRCQKSCPIGTNIPEMINLLLEDNIKEAGEQLFKNNPLSAICSLICPHEKQCEGNCVLGIKGEPIKVGSIEHYISNKYLDKKACQKEGKHLGKVAIVGSGPAGMSIAFLLSIKGYDITMYDANDQIGGVLRYGIPEFRLPKSLLDRLKDKLVEMGVIIRPNTLIGPVVTVHDLFRDGFDAVFIGTGVWNPRKLNIAGESLGHVHYAIDYLKSPDVYNLGDHVCVIGAGNVAMDAARTAIRQGTKKVTVMYRKGREEVSATNHEVESAINEGVCFKFWSSPIKLEEKSINYVETKHDDKLIDKQIDVDSIIIAVSQGPKSNIVSKTKEIQTGDSGLVITDENGSTTKDGVFASGDVVTGAKTVVAAVEYSKIVADAIHKYVEEKKLHIKLNYGKIS
jgi:glutamate synthase (NADPH/NADH) small chain